MFSSIARFFARLLSAPQPSFNQMEVKFHKAANFFGEHGTICVTHVKQNLREVPVRFVFVGITTPPPLTLALMAYVWEEAKAQGYIPHDLQTYGMHNEICKLGNIEDAMQAGSHLAGTMPAGMGEVGVDYNIPAHMRADTAVSVLPLRHQRG